MKKLLLIMAIAIISLSADAQFSKATLQANGLTCALCSNAINKALQKVGFVESVKSDIKNTAFNIQFKQGSEVNVDQIRKAVEEAGFSVGSLKLTGDFNNLKVENDQHHKIGNANFHFVNVKNQVLNGEQTITIVDKNFVSDKTFKAMKAATKKDCINTGKASHCCSDVAQGARIYHTTI